MTRLGDIIIEWVVQFSLNLHGLTGQPTSVQAPPDRPTVAVPLCCGVSGVPQESRRDELSDTSHSLAVAVTQRRELCLSSCIVEWRTD